MILTDDIIKTFSMKKYIKYRTKIKKFYKTQKQQKILTLDKRISRIFYDIHSRCNNPNKDNYKYYGGRGIKNLISQKELKELWFRDKAYLMKKPSIDRINNDGNYEYNNCRFIEMNKNRDIGRKTIPILQFDLYNYPIAEWISLTDASKNLKINITGLSHCLKGKRKTCGGFIWKYK